MEKTVQPIGRTATFPNSGGHCSGFAPLAGSARCQLSVAALAAWDESSARATTRAGKSALLADCLTECLHALGTLLAGRGFHTAGDIDRVRGDLRYRCGDIA